MTAIYLLESEPLSEHYEDMRVTWVNDGIDDGLEDMPIDLFLDIYLELRHDNKDVHTTANDVADYFGIAAPNIDSIPSLECIESILTKTTCNTRSKLKVGRFDDETTTLLSIGQEE